MLNRLKRQVRYEETNIEEDILVANGAFFKGKEKKKGNNEEKEKGKGKNKKLPPSIPLLKRLEFIS